MARPAPQSVFQPLLFAEVVVEVALALPRGVQEGQVRRCGEMQAVALTGCGSRSFGRFEALREDSKEESISSRHLSNVLNSSVARLCHSAMIRHAASCMQAGVQQWGSACCVYLIDSMPQHTRARLFQDAGQHLKVVQDVLARGMGRHMQHIGAWGEKWVPHTILQHIVGGKFTVHMHLRRAATRAQGQYMWSSQVQLGASSLNKKRYDLGGKVNIGACRDKHGTGAARVLLEIKHRRWGTDK